MHSCDKENNEIIADLSHHELNGEILPALPPGVEPLEHQLAGHKFGHKENHYIYGILDCKNGTILKPVITQAKGERERYFYELVNGIHIPNEYYTDDLYKEADIKQLKSLTPEFLGIIHIPEHPNVVYIKMVDETYGLSRPHIIDVKIGAKAWAPDSTQEKIKRQKGRCPYLDEIKFQILGARYFDAYTGEKVVELGLRKLSPQDLLSKGLVDIFASIPRKTRSTLLQLIIQKLRSIRSWFQTQKILSFHGSSILIVFEGDVQVLMNEVEPLDQNTDDLELSKYLRVKMIDFVHVWQTDSIDLNYLEGLDSLLSYFEQLLKRFSMECLVNGNH